MPVHDPDNCQSCNSKSALKYLLLVDVMQWGTLAFHYLGDCCSVYITWWRMWLFSVSCYISISLYGFRFGTLWWCKQSLCSAVKLNWNRIRSDLWQEKVMHQVWNILIVGWWRYNACSFSTLVCCMVLLLQWHIWGMCTERSINCKMCACLMVNGNWFLCMICVQVDWWWSWWCQ